MPKDATKRCGLTGVLVAILLLGQFLVAGRGALSQAPSSSPTTGSKTEKENLTFRVVARGSGTDEGATKLGFRTFGTADTFFSHSTFEASDGERLAVRYGTFASASEAKRYLDHKLSEVAETVLVQGEKKDKDGNVVGYRAEALTKAPPKGGAFAVMWTIGAGFRIVYSHSLSDAVELEKQYKD